MRALVFQAILLAVVAAIFVLLGAQVWEGLRRDGIAFSFSFLDQQASFDVAQGLTLVRSTHGFTVASFNPGLTNWQALVAGVYNTLVAALSAIVLSTILGVLIAVLRMSQNWIARNYAWGFVEFVRNTPLLIQILFWYFGVFLQLPRPNGGTLLHGWLIASQQGVHIAWFASPSDAFVWLMTLVAMGVLLVAWKTRRLHVRSVSMTIIALCLLIFSAMIGWHIPGIEMPSATRFSVSGGLGMSPEMLSLAVALSVNTAAYIAEIVRGAVESIDKGQWEAAATIGLSHQQSFWQIILPQAMKMIIPSLGNQYISLAKSTSFGIAIGFPDLFNVYGTVANQTGHPLEGIIIVMALYLGVSLLISAAVNAYNRHVIAKEAR